MKKQQWHQKFGLVALALFFTALCMTEGWAQPSSSVPVSQGQLLVRLPYRAESEKPLQEPYRVALFETGTEFYVARVLGCDWQGNFYLFDAARQDRTLLKRFDRKGRFQEMWELPRSRRSSSLTVTRDGTIWLDVEQVEGASGLPLLAYRSGSKQPIANWRRKLPVVVENAMKKALAKQGFIRTGLWYLTAMGSGKNQVWMRFSGPVADVGKKPNYSTSINSSKRRGVWLLLNSKGNKVLGSRFYDPQDPLLTQKLPLIPDGFTDEEKPYFTQSDMNIDNRQSSAMWAWTQGQSKGKPVFTLTDLTKGKESWHRALAVNNKILPPLTYWDARDNLYLIWGRDSQAGERRFTVGDKSWTRGPLTWYEGEKALVVLDKNRRCIAFVPWRPTYYELLEQWIHPLPDGSGFYRQDYAEKELRIYFHALPKSK